MNRLCFMLMENIEWKDHEANPLIEAPGREWIIADPTFLPPEQTPDNKWHLFAHSLLGIHHYISDDGIAWQKHGKKLFGGMRPYLYVDEGRYILLNEQLRSPWW